MKCVSPKRRYNTQIWISLIRNFRHQEYIFLLILEYTFFPWPMRAQYSTALCSDWSEGKTVILQPDKNLFSEIWLFLCITSTFGWDQIISALSISSTPPTWQCIYRHVTLKRINITRYLLFFSTIWNVVLARDLASTQPAAIVLRSLPPSLYVKKITGRSLI